MPMRVLVPNREGRTRGLTLLELLIASVVLVAVLGVSATFLSQQSRVSVRTQAASEAEVTSRTLAEYVVQDLQIAGSRVVISGGSPVSVPIGCSAASGTFCVTSTDNGNADTVTATYATSIDPTVQCRSVQYSLTNGQLLRSDVLCGAAAAPQVLANGVDAFDVSWFCSDNATEPTANGCYKDADGDGELDVFPRQATVRIATTSTDREAVAAEQTLTTNLHNQRN